MSVNESNPLVSIVIPCYNHQDYVQECIQSVIDQDYQNIELIIIDDGSSDNSVQKIEEMINVCQQRFIKFEFRHRPNKGLCATLNEALDKCEGEYISSIASDDIMIYNKTSVQVNYLEKNTNSIGVFGGVGIIDEQGTIIKKSVKSAKKYTFLDILLHNHTLPAPTNMCRAKDLKKHKYSTELKIEDWDMWLKLTYKSNRTIDYLPIMFALYRRHENNMSSNNTIMHFGRLEILNQYKSHPLYKQALTNARLTSANENTENWLAYIKSVSSISLRAFFKIKTLKVMVKKLLNVKRIVQNEK